MQRVQLFTVAIDVDGDNDTWELSYRVRITDRRPDRDGESLGDPAGRSFGTLEGSLGYVRGCIEAFDRGAGEELR